MRWLAAAPTVGAINGYETLTRDARWYTYLHTKNPNLGIFRKALEWKMFVFYGYIVYFMAIWYILRPFDIFYGYLVHFFRVGMLYQEKSGNPDPDYVHT
jgi:carbon starvation protein CstA